MISIFLLMLADDPRIPLATAASDSSDKSKAPSNKELPLDEISRGLKSAAKNIEEDIPKTGPAIGKTFRQVTGRKTQPNKFKESLRNRPSL
jgi:hypothetical protein